MAMARMTGQARAAGGRPGTRARAVRILRPLSLFFLVVALLLAAGALSSTAMAETNKLPKVIVNPVSATVEEQQSANFTSSASGVPAPTIQWERSIDGGVTWSAVPGASGGTLTIASATTAESGDEFRAVFTNIVGKATSKLATLTVRKLPEVTLQPASVTIEEGQNAAFEASASGFPAPTVQWQTSTNSGVTWVNLAGATSPKLTVANAKTSSSGHLYRAVFTNTAGKVTTSAATLTVQKLPAVTESPANLTREEGQNAVFEATASGFPAPTVQWQVSIDGGSTWTAITGATTDQLTVTAVTRAEDGYRYRAVFTNPAGTATSGVAALTVRAAPVVTQQPSSTTVAVGEGASFEAVASGYPAPAVQWELSTNGGSSWAAIPGATSSQLTIAETVVSEDGREYRAVFANVAGKATSSAAVLTVATTHYNAVAWGENLYRELGNGATNADSAAPEPVVGLKFVTAVSAGGRHGLALLANGNVVSWGDNESGQLGNGSTETSNVPVAVTGLSGVKAIAAGANHSLALLNNGTVMAWGANEGGQLGNGTTTGSEVPVAVKGLTGVKAIAAGGAHSLALLNNGKVMAWGDDAAGQLGDGSTKASSVPVAVKELTGVTAISAGGEFSLALQASGTVDAWGTDENGQLGNAIVEEGSDVPVAVESLSGATAIAAGETHALALLGSGSVMAWGEDAYGELGNGEIKPRHEAPVAVSGLTGVTAIAAGAQASAALLGSGSVVSWGSNQWGTLGNGQSGAPSDVPVTVSGVRKVASVSVGGAFMLAYGEPTPSVTAVTPNLGPAAGGTSVTIEGADFKGATAVKFGAAEATGLTVNSPNSITAIAPAGTGTVDATVITPAGVSAILPADRYTYQPPATITKLSAKSGPVTGGTPVTITGSAFTGTKQVTIGGVGVTFTVVSDSSMRIVAPAVSVAGTDDIVITNTAGPSALSSSDRFKYVPVVEALTPPSGLAAGGETITVTGAGFATGTSATSLKFGSAKARSVSCESSTSCTAVVPAGAVGTVTVTATVAKNVSTGNSPGDQYTYH
jgi:alpha-tubulin suppressor-like RCC1 family protein